MFLAPKTLLLMPYPDLLVPPPPQLRPLHLNPSSTPSTWSPLPPVLISPPCQLSNPLALPSKLCCPAPLSPSFPFPISKPPFFATCPPVLFVLWYQRLSGRVCSFLYMLFLILEYVHPGDFYLQDLCAPGCPRTSASGQEIASGVSRVKFKPT